MRAAVVACLLGACAYHPGSFDSYRTDFRGAHATVGCLDVSVEHRPLGDAGTALTYAFGNRCDHAAIVDLADASVVGRTADGRDVPLAAFDPHHEITPLYLDGRSAGTEAIAYRSEAPLAQVCVDAATIAHAPAEHWLCFAVPHRPTPIAQVTR